MALTPEISEDDVNSWLTSIGDGSPISVENSRNFLPVFFNIANGDHARYVYDRFIEVYKGSLDTVNGEDSVFTVESTDELSTTFACPEGGTYVVSTAEIQRVAIKHEFNACLIGDESFEGSLVTFYADFSDPVKPHYSLTSNLDDIGPFVYRDSSGVQFTTRGLYDDTRGANLNGIADGDRYQWSGQIEIDDGSQLLTFERGNSNVARYVTPATDRNATELYKTFSSTMNLSGAITNGRNLRVQTLNPFRTIDNLDQYSSGILIMFDEDGGRLSMTADPELPGGFTIRVDTEGQVDEYFESWSDTLDFIRMPTPTP